MPCVGGVGLEFKIILDFEKDLAIKVFNISDKGIHWESVLRDLHSSKPAVFAIPFKGVTDIFVVGKATTMTVLVRVRCVVILMWPRSTI